MSIETSSTTTPYGSKSTLTPAATPTDAESGTGGGDMRYWTGLPDDEQLERVSATYSVEASYTLPAGVASISHTKGEATTTTPSGVVEDGVGGGTMSVWLASREEKLDTLASGTYTVESEFGIPAGVVNSDGYSYYGDGELGVSVSVRGNPVGGDETPLPGTATILYGDEPVSQVAVDGAFTVAADPPDAITSGSDVTASSQYNFRFDPDVGFGKISEDLPAGATKVELLFGSVTISISDYDGTTLPGERMEIDTSDGSASAKTDVSGEATVSAPGGTTLTVTALQGAASEDVSVAELDSTSLGLQYSALDFTIELANGVRPENAPVTYNGITKTTDENGTVRFSRIPPLSTIDLLVYGGATISADTSDQGIVGEKLTTAGSAVEGQARSLRGAGIRNIDAAIIGTDGTRYRAQPDANGNFTVGAFDSGKMTVEVGRDDRRFKAKEIEYDFDAGETLQRDFGLEEKLNVTSGL